uniref:beta-mannosidase n=1 Tax=Salarias fasciatus TaxID=181472 RepID=A0A672HVY4_SALFA
MRLAVRLCLPALWCVFGGVFSEFSSQLSLTGKWSLRNSNRSVSLPVQVPGCVHSALQQQGYIQDPYYRFNDVSYRWISLENWTYTTTFSVPASLRLKRKVLLVFDGVDTVSTVSLNGIAVGTTDNMFLRYDFSVRDLLKDGENVLEVRFLSPVLYASEQRKAHPYRVPPECPPEVQHGECHVNFIRKAQSSFSWDWGPSFPSVGLWRPVRLEAFDALRLVQVSCVPLYSESSASSTFNPPLRVKPQPCSSVNTVVIWRGIDLHSLCVCFFSFLFFSIFQKKEVKLWWPNGHGEQPFYNLTIQGFQDLFSSKVYFRTVDLYQGQIVGTPGLGFFFRVNGKPIFLKGSNWIPAHSFQDQVTPAVLRNLLQSAVDANMNALRVWGGGVYEQDLFYHICDEMGIMVWQDFMFACAMYPTEADFIQTVREEVLQQVTLCFPLEFLSAGVNYDIYTHEKQQMSSENTDEVKHRPFLVSSPTNGVESEQEGWVAADPYDPLYGDVHFYSYLADCWDWRTFPRTRFTSEYGFQSWPSFSTLQPISRSEDWSYDSNFSSHRQHHQDGNQQMLLQAALHFHLPNSSEPLRRFTDTLYITQVMQAQCVKTQTEFYRRSRSEAIEGKGYTMGALYWQLNDIWQAPSWSSIEFGGKWKMLHYFAQSFFAAVLPVGFEDDGTMFVYAVSDLSQELKLRTVTVHSWSDPDPVCRLESDLVPVPAGSAVPVFRRPVAALLAGCGRCTRLTCLLTFRLEDAGGSQQGPTNHHFLCSPKDARGLQRPNITAKVQEDERGFTVSLRSAAVAPFVWLDVGSVPGRFSSNGFLMVSRNVTVGFNAWRPTSVAELSASLTVTSLTDVYRV